MTDSRTQLGRQEWRVAVGAQETSAVFEAAEDMPDAPVFVCAHGAGGNLADKSIVALTRTLRSRGLSTVRFNFLYREKKSGRPDPMPRLEECFSAVVAHARAELNPRTMIIGGRSMGGRAASMLAAAEFAADGLLLLAYPLHPPGQPEKLRDAHLGSIEVPVLCFSGTRDPFCTRALMETALKSVKTRWDMQWIEGADHSFHILKSSGKTDAQVVEEVADHTRGWVALLKQ
ncbi:MAG: dienelactone hydrolase family protein [Gemmatimonadota bacterium]|nr:dienelactone hydrolase family protein [Gemmatimonadota bacterium]